MISPVHCTEVAWPFVQEVGHNPVEVGHSLVVVGHNLVGGERFQTLPQSNRRGQTCGSLECAKQFLDLDRLSSLASNDLAVLAIECTSKIAVEDEIINK